jgi:hypothetical protein
LLDAVFALPDHLSRWKIVDFVHTLPEWHDPEGGAIRIEYADILRAFNRKPEEIAAIVIPSSKVSLDCLSNVATLSSYPGTPGRPNTSG